MDGQISRKIRLPGSDVIFQMYTNMHKHPLIVNTSTKKP